MKLLRATIAFTFGIAIERALTATPSTLEITVAVSATVLVLASAIFVRKNVTLAVLFLLLVLGVVRAATGASNNESIHWEDIPRNEERIRVEGVLISEPSPSKERVRLRLQADNGYLVDVYAGRLHDQTDSKRRSDDFRYGDTYLASGRFILTPRRDDIAGIISTSSVELIDVPNDGNLRSRIAGARASISHALTDSLDSKTGGLAAALLVGDRTKLHPDTITDFRAAGLSHVLAISGLHIAMIGGIVMAISVWILGRQRQLYLIAPGVMIWIYAALAGFTPSVTRAAIMFTVYLVARLLGRQKSVLPPLALAAALMLVVNPGIIQSISFQLSFAAVLGIALLSAPLASKGSDRIQASTRIPRFLKQPLIGIVYGMSVSFAATIATAPLVAFHFDEVPIWGIPSTLLVVPVLPLFIGGSALLALAGVFSTEPIALAGVLSHLFGNYISFVAGVFGGLPIGPVDAEGWSVPLIVGWYGLVLGLVNRRRLAGRTKRLVEIVSGQLQPTAKPRATTDNDISRRRLLPVAAVWLIATFSVVGFAVTNPASTNLTATFFETDRGDMIFIETPSGVRLLVDGGDNPELAVSNLESVLPPLDRRIDVVLSTHPDADHLGGLQRIVEQFDVEIIVDSGVSHDSNIYKSWQQFVRNDERLTTATPGMVISLDPETTLTVLQTRCVVVECTNFNDEGVVARLDFDEVSFLLTGDVTSGGELDLIQTGKSVNSTVLKAGHHGSRSSTTQQFLDAVDPALAIVTTGIKNQFGHPHDDVIERLENHLSPEAVYVTRDNGSVTVTTNGERLWVSAER